jgi:hypothetical protein
MKISTTIKRIFASAPLLFIDTTATKEDDSMSRKLLDARDVPGCVSTERQLRSAIKSASTGSNPTTILLCRKKISISNTLDPVLGFTGINLSGKTIKMRCNTQVAGTDTCILDGQGKSRIFFGYKTKLSVTGVSFENSFGESDGLMSYGSALEFFDKSNLVVDKCSFKNNNADYAGALHMDNSTLVLKSSSLSDNEAVNWVRFE